MKNILIFAMVFFLPLSAFAAVKEYKSGDSFDSFTGLVEFYDPKCPHCKNMEPVIEKISETMPVYRVNIAEFKDMAAKWNVFSWPTFAVLKDGKEIGGVIGERPADIFLKEISNPKPRQMTPPQRPGAAPDLSQHVYYLSMATRDLYRELKFTQLFLVLSFVALAFLWGRKK